MGKFADTPKRTKIKKPDLEEIYYRQFGKTPRRLNRDEIASRILKFGKCECGCKNVLSGFGDFDHKIPLGLQIQEEGKPPPKIKWQVLLPECHKQKTGKDRKMIDKAKSLAGITGNGRKKKIPSRGFRKDVRKKMNGEVVRVNNGKAKY